MGRWKLQRLLSSPLSMESLMHLAEVFVSDVGVDLRRCDVGVAQEGLDCTQIRPAVE